MQILSAIFYFVSQHPFWSFPLIILLGLVISTVMAIRKRNAKCYLLIIVFFLLAQFNIFFGHFANAVFLNAFGTTGSAVVTHAEETSSTLNDQNVWEYDAVLKTADGRDVVTNFDTMTATIYPIRNAILIPPQGERFVAKYVPGFERNIVIMSDLSPYGKTWLVDEDRPPVEKAAAQLAASPANPAFIAEYCDALQTFINKHRNDAEPGLIREYELTLEALKASQK